MQFVSLWAGRHPEDSILLRDLGHQPVPHITEPWIIGSAGLPEAQTPESRAAIAVSDQQVEEFLGCDRFIFGLPMHNFNIPSTFKAYIDHLVRPGKTFAVGPNGFEGLVKDRKALFITTSGQSYAPATARNLEPYLRTIFEFIGLTDLTFVTAENLDRGEEAVRQARQRAENRLRELVESW
jgi:FMN-dependent NADH-azoreductase